MNNYLIEGLEKGKRPLLNNPAWVKRSKPGKLALLLLEYHRQKQKLGRRSYLKCLRLSGYKENEAEAKAEWFVSHNKINGKRILLGSHTRDEWIAKKQQYNNRCFYCGKMRINLTKDHIIPVSSGGKNTIDNIIPACRLCNSRKHTKPIECFKEGANLKLV